MQKCHLPSTIGRGGSSSAKYNRTRNALLLCHRQLHTSRPCRVEGKANDPTLQRPARSPTQAKRLQDASTDIQNLFRKSIARGRPQPSNSRSLPPSRGIDARSLAAKPSPAQSSPHGIDARSLGASPPPNAPRFTITREYIDTNNNNDRSSSTPYPSTTSPSSIRRNPPSLPSRPFSLPPNRSTRDPRTGKSSSSTRRPPGGKPPTKRRSTANPRSASSEDKASTAAMWATYHSERAAQLAAKPVAFEPGKLEGRGDLEGVGPAVVSGVWGMREIVGERVRLAERFLGGGKEGEKDADGLWGWNEGKGAWENRRARGEVRRIVEGVIRAASASSSSSSRNGGEVGEGEAGKKSGGVEVDRGGSGGGGKDAMLTQLLSGRYVAAYPALRSGTAMAGGKSAGDVLQHVARQTAQNSSYEPVDERSFVEKVRSMIAAPAPAGARAGGGGKREVSVKG